MPKKRLKSEPYDDSPVTAAERKTARRLRDDPVMMSAVRRSQRGRPAGTAKKEAVTLSLDKDLVAKFRASGAGWQTRLNEALRTMMGLLA